MRCVSSRFLTAVPRLLHRVHQLARQALFHRALAALARSVDQPADGQRLAPLGADFHGHLIGGATDAARTHLDGRLHIVQRLMEQPHGSLLPPLRFSVSMAAYTMPSATRLLAVIHQHVHETAEDNITELRVRQNFALLCAVTTRHVSAPHFGRLAP
jgi:hypothetical protein